ncbi:MAG: hypothetical protein HQ581_04925 [Planctomycetes bacterium]|nr:hypothetical protein [Planctomycetota bacterium]
MSIRNFAIPGALIAAMLSAAASELRAQPRPAPQRISAKGTVKEVYPRLGIVMTTATQQTWQIAIPQTANVKVTGTAEENFLKPGMFIQFNGEVDKRGNYVLGKVGQLLIFNPSRERMPGMFGADPTLGGGGQAGGGLGAGAPMFGPAPGAEKPGGPANKGMGMALLGGQISTLKGKRMTVAVPNVNARLRVELADEVKIGVEVTDFSVAQEGDKIQISGTMIQESTTLPNGTEVPGRGTARDVTIEMAKPLVDPKKKPRIVPPPRTRPARPTKPAKPDEKPEGFEVAEPK